MAVWCGGYDQVQIKDKILMNRRRFAVLSHVLPPSPSGQSVMLYRILSHFNASDYYLISRETYKRNKDDNLFLPVEYFQASTPRLLNYLNHIRFPQRLFEFINAVISIVCRTWKVARIALRNPIQAIVACSGDIADIPAGYFVSRLLNIDLYVYMFDDYVYQWTGAYRSVAKNIAPRIFKKNVRLIGPNEYICNEYSRLYNMPYAIVRNPCSSEELNISVYEYWPSEPGRIKVMYTGAIYHANYDCFRNLIKAMELITTYWVELHIYTAQNVEELSRQGIQGSRVHVHSHVSYHQILEEQHKADILFLPLAFESPISEVIRTSAPGKMGEYLASGRPVLAHVPADSFVAYYIKRHQCGILADKNDPADLATHILKLVLDDYRHGITENARRQARLDFDPRISYARLNDYLPSSTPTKK
jgi:glycosyltransferase involved in cell wall biosynthesis